MFDIDMGSNVRTSPKLDHPSDSSDAKFISCVSTNMVATIQEAKDRISQIEYMFCSQLYPIFQSNPQSSYNICSEAEEESEDAYRQKKKNLLLQIEKVLEENQSLKLEKMKITDMERQSFHRVEELQKELNQKTIEANEGMETCQNLQKLLESKSSLLHSYETTIGELKERNIMLLEMQKKLDVGTEELKQELMRKSKEVDEMMELKNKLLQINQTNSSLIVQKDAQLMENEGQINIVVSKLANMEDKAHEMLSVLDKGKELQGNLLKKVESQALEIMNQEQELNKYEKENRLLAAELEKKSVEMEELIKGQQLLLQQTDSPIVERAERERALEESTEEGKRLLDKQKGLENEVGKLERILSERTKEFSEGMELHEKLLQKIELKDSELRAKRRGNTYDFTAHKKLKSQYNHLLNKCDLTPETGFPLDKMEDESEIIRRNQTPVTYHDMKRIIGLRGSTSQSGGFSRGASSSVVPPLSGDSVPDEYTSEEFESILFANAPFRGLDEALEEHLEEEGMPPPPPHQSSSQSGSRKKSTVFAVHFHKIPDPSGVEGEDFFAVCNHCENRYKQKKRNGYGSLIRHMSCKHPAEWGIGMTETQMHLESFGVTTLKTCNSQGRMPWDSYRCTKEE